MSESHNQSDSSSLDLAQDFFELGEVADKDKSDSNQFYNKNEQVEEKKNPYDLSVKEIEDLLIQKQIYEKSQQPYLKQKAFKEEVVQRKKSSKAVLQGPLDLSKITPDQIYLSADLEIYCNLLTENQKQIVSDLFNEQKLKILKERPGGASPEGNKNFRYGHLENV